MERPSFNQKPAYRGEKISPLRLAARGSGRDDGSIFVRRLDRSAAGAYRRDLAETKGLRRIDPRGPPTRRLHSRQPEPSRTLCRDHDRYGSSAEEHRQGWSEHTSRYNITKLVYLESHETAPQAIEREKQIKKWRRDKKIALIEGTNPEWLDLSNEIL